MLTPNPHQLASSPEQFHVFQHQVAGHGAIRQYLDGRQIIKPAIPQEVKFYTALRNLPDLAPFVPTFHGLLKFDESQNHQPFCLPKSPEKPRQDEFVILENICFGMSKPCILDLKMGTRHYGEFADEEKRQRAIRKCLNSTSGTMGFRICGMQVYHPRSERIVKWDKQFGRALNEASVVDAFRLFLWDSEQLRLDLVPLFLESLRNLLNVIRTLSGYRFYSSSLLLIYEGEPQFESSNNHNRNNSNDNDNDDNNNQPSSPNSTSSPSLTLDDDPFFNPFVNPSPIHNNQKQRSPPSPQQQQQQSNNNNNTNSSTASHTDLRMIDFAKTYFHPSSALSADDPDPGFVLGLENIIRCLESLLQQKQQISNSNQPPPTTTTTTAAKTAPRFSLSDFAMTSTLFEMTRSASLSIPVKPQHNQLGFDDDDTGQEGMGGDEHEALSRSVA